MKRLLAALLTLSMLVGIVPFSAFAESPGAVPETFAAAQESPGLDDETVQSIVSDPLLQGQYAPPQQAQPTVDTSNMSMEATDSFGKLLVNSIDEQNSASSSENRVIGVTVDGSTATVEYVAAEDADIVVALYTDDSEELMSASGTVDVFAMEENTGHSTVTVPLTGSIPASFIVKAFLLDKDEHAPLCNEFTSLAYTKDLSDLESSTIYDYPENQVVNLDEDVSNNFAVVTSDVTLITSDENIDIDYSAFDGCSDLTTVNYAGSPEQWNNIKIANHNDELLNATRHYYSSNASTVSSEENSIFPSTATGNDHSFAASFSDLTPGVSYAVIVSRSEIDPLAPENLIYINQFRATSSGYQQSFQTPRSSALNADDMTYVIASGIYSFDEAPTPTPTPGGGSSSGGGGGGGGGAAVLIGVGAAAAITAGVIMMSPVEIKGRVVLADQAAVPGAKISLLREGKVVAQTTADENGSFSLKAKRGSYELTAAYTTADGQLIYKTIDIKAPAKDLTVTF